MSCSCSSRVVAVEAPLYAHRIFCQTRKLGAPYGTYRAELSASSLLVTQPVKPEVVAMNLTKRRSQLSQEPAGVVSIHHANVPHRLIRRQVPGAEEQVPNDGGIAEIARGGLRIARMVPAMRLRASHHIVEPAVAQLKITVLEESVDEYSRK